MENRPKLRLKPRTVDKRDLNEKAPISGKTDPFAGAKPRDERQFAKQTEEEPKESDKPAE